MESVLDCFGNIIGTMPENDSDSGLYITDLEAVETIKGLLSPSSMNDDEFDLEQKLLSARRIAILALHTDLTTLMMRYSKVRDGFSGLVGSKRYNKILNETGKSGIRIVCRSIKDAELKIKSINTIFAESGTFDVYIANNYNDEIEIIENVVSVANTLKQNAPYNSITLPLYDVNAEGCVEYYIYHENDFKPLNNPLQCSTCRKFIFNAEMPTWKHYGAEQYIHVAGFNGEPENLSYRGDNTGKGLQLQIEIVCRADKSLCRDSIKFDSDPYAMSLASAVQYKAGSVIIWDLIRNPSLNRVLMGDMESFREAASYYQRKYNDMVKYISKSMPLKSDCFCEQGFTNVTIGHAR